MKEEFKSKKSMFSIFIPKISKLYLCFWRENSKISKKLGKRFIRNHDFYFDSSREFEEGDLNIEDAFIAHNPTDVIDEEMIQYEEIAKEEEKDDLSFKSRQKQLPKW